MNEIKADYEGLKTLGFAAIGANFVGIQDMSGNPASALHPIRIHTILNNTNADLLFSIDGIKPFVLIPALRSFTDDVCSNRTDQAGGSMLPEGTRLYIKDNGIAPTTGAIYWTILYGKEI